MVKPLILTASWFGVAAAFSLSLPVLALAGKLGGGLLALVGLAAVSGSGLCLIGYSWIWTSRLRPSLGLAAISVAVPPIAVFLGALMFPVLTELSWQFLHGPRNVPIWPYTF